MSSYQGVNEAKKEFEIALDLFKKRGNKGEAEKVEDILKMLETAPVDS